ncbi:MAG: hypothetical protein EXQ58_00920 [Acidobacteria bacterium]|nr:hypothetical protein [Acidobacteriota bacterium]
MKRPILRSTDTGHVLTLEAPHRFASSRAVGSFLGLRPGKDKFGTARPGTAALGAEGVRPGPQECQEAGGGPQSGSAVTPALGQRGKSISRCTRQNERLRQSLSPARSRS